MPDITLCANEKCPQRDNCYRAQAEPSEYWQAYAIFNNQGLPECEYFMPLAEDLEQE